MRDDLGWRASVAEAALGLVVALLAVVLVSLLASRAELRFDSLEMVVAGSLAMALLCSQLRSLPLSVRTLGVVMPLTAVNFVSMAQWGITPNANLASALAAIVLGVVVGWRTAGAYLVATVAGFLLLGWLVVDERLVVDRSAMRTDDYRNWLRVAANFAVAAMALGVTVWLVVRRVDRALAERARQQAELADAYELLGRLHRRVESAKEDERRHLSHELHDEMGQALTSLKLRLKLALAAGADSKAIQDALAVVDDVVTQVRHMSLELRPALLDEAGLVPAVRAYLESHAALATTALTFDASGLDDRLPAELETAAFRVIQESVTNVARHAGASRVDVTLSRDASHLAIRVRDDGAGFDVDARLSAAARAGHLGVAGMRERVKGFGGRFDVTSAPGGGTEVSAAFPLDAR
ncbi:MAG TPA: sensor histidine kinase [Kofleriaceae bacterium]|nr:sensor histidine kinase [Kofleriaceae bacterium]